MTVSPAISPWIDSGATIVGSRDGLSVSLDPGDPLGGLRVTGDPHGATRLLGLDLGGRAELVEHWARCEDLVVVYEPSDGRRLRVTAMWRWLGDPVAGDRADSPMAAWMVVVSAQTALLDSDPRLAVDSRVPGPCVRWGTTEPGAPRWRSNAEAGACAALVRGPGGRSTLVAVHPEDRRSFTVGLMGDAVGVRCGLFPERLEKGVLLRGRALAAVGPTAGDEAWAAHWIARLAAEPPPLST